MKNKQLEHYQESFMKGKNDMSVKVLTVIQETEILGKKIRMYGSIDEPLFLASDVAEWIDYAYASSKQTSRQTGKMLKTIDEDEKTLATLGGNNVTPQNNTHGGLRSNTEMWFVSEDGLYEICMQSRKPIAKQMKKEIKQYLKSIRLTGAAIPEGKEQEMVNYYFSGLSDELKGNIVHELIEKNKELQDFYNQLMNTEGLMQINTVAKELGIGEYKLFEFLRRKKVLFYDKDMVNVPYERFRKEGKFSVKETPCHDGQTRSVTYATKRGLEYIRKLLKKNGYYDTALTSK